MALQEPDFINAIATSLEIRANQVRRVVELLADGNTIPFIARYRKEMTGELDENQIRDIAARHESMTSLHQRKRDIVRLLDEQGVLSNPLLSADLTAAIQASTTLTELDDIYRPYRPKRKTRASIARERGLEPLTAWLLAADRKGEARAQSLAYMERFAVRLDPPMTVQEAVSGAADIFAERVADHAKTRQWIRDTTLRRGSLQSVAVDPEQDSAYSAYYDFQERAAKALPYRVLAMNRGEREGFLRISLTAPVDDIVAYLQRTHLPRFLADAAERVVPDILDGAIRDAYKRLIAPSIEREVRSQLTTHAEEHAIQIFGENLRNLLLQPPLAGKVVLGVDPAYRTGCKLAVIDATGKLLTVAVIYPTLPKSNVHEAQRTFLALLVAHSVNLVVIGNGTASRETESFVADCLAAYKGQTDIQIPYLIVSEAGASVYSASVLAGEEFPQLDVSERSAVSIARRVQDPLAELVKIDPKSVGVGQYQHDVSEQKLSEKLTAVVESAVNGVGVNVNTASPSLLSYVAGLNRTVANNIVAVREDRGRFRSRKALAEVPRLGKKTLEQSVGFLRILDGDEALDATGIHPESYPVVERLFRQSGASRAVLRSPAERQSWIDGLRNGSLQGLADDLGVGLPTLRDILDGLERPGRDPREDVPPPLLRTDVLKLEDLEIGTRITGTVRNVVDFGAFVDVGLKNDGLVHISELADRFVKHPMDVVAIGDVVAVRVIQIDVGKQRLGLSMKGISG